MITIHNDIARRRNLLWATSAEVFVSLFLVANERTLADCYSNFRATSISDDAAMLHYSPEMEWKLMMQNFTFHHKKQSYHFNHRPASNVHIYLLVTLTDPLASAASRKGSRGERHGFEIPGASQGKATTRDWRWWEYRPAHPTKTHSWVVWP